jgi:Cu(I)/Ag(I) efflux system periplasmic protein CusF
MADMAGIDETPITQRTTQSRRVTQSNTNAAYLGQPQHSQHEVQMKRSSFTSICALAFSTTLPIAAVAADAVAPANVPATASKANGAAAETTIAEIKKIDKDAKKITLKHEEIKPLDMPPMTMVFQVKDNAMLEGLKPGDKVKFRAEKTKGGYAVLSIEAVK